MNVQNVGNKDSERILFLQKHIQKNCQDAVVKSGDDELLVDSDYIISRSIFNNAEWVFENRHSDLIYLDSYLFQRRCFEIAYEGEYGFLTTAPRSTCDIGRKTLPEDPKAPKDAPNVKLWKDVAEVWTESDDSSEVCWKLDEVCLKRHFIQGYLETALWYPAANCQIEHGLSLDSFPNAPNDRYYKGYDTRFSLETCRNYYRFYRRTPPGSRTGRGYFAENYTKPQSNWMIYADFRFWSFYYGKKAWARKKKRHDIAVDGRTLGTVFFPVGNEGKNSVVLNYLTVQQDLEMKARNHSDENRRSLLELLYETAEEAKADKTKIPNEIKRILMKIAHETDFRGLTEAEKSKIRSAVKNSKKIEGAMYYAKTQFGNKRILEAYQKTTSDVALNTAVKKVVKWILTVVIPPAGTDGFDNDTTADVQYKWNRQALAFTASGIRTHKLSAKNLRKLNLDPESCGYVKHPSVLMLESDQKTDQSTFCAVICAFPEVDAIKVAFFNKEDQPIYQLVLDEFEAKNGWNSFRMEKNIPLLEIHAIEITFGKE